MKRKAVEAAIGYRHTGVATYGAGVVFKTTDSRRVGVVRHSTAEKAKGGGMKLAEDVNGCEFWHFHETNGRHHCTRSVKGTELVRVAS